MSILSDSPYVVTIWSQSIDTYCSNTKDFKFTLLPIFYKNGHLKTLELNIDSLIGHKIADIRDITCIHSQSDLKSVWIHLRKGNVLFTTVKSMREVKNVV